MSGIQTALLGAIAGLTIFLGLPVGRIRNLSTRTRTFLNAAAGGVLAFLVYEFIEQATEKIEAGNAALRAGLFVGTLVLSLGGLLAYGALMRSRMRHSRPAGPGAASTTEMQALRATGLTNAQRLALLIAIGIGLHNLAEGLAIGQSAALGQYSLALLLIIGFALHNATEGFGIVGPITGSGERASWPFLIMLGLIAGGPTFVGTLIGQVWVNETFAVAVLGLAAGSVLYVLYEMARSVMKHRHWLLLTVGVALGVAFGAATELVVELAK